jgi:LPXTG-site transpeptidase (sortase) family protein
LLEEFRTVSQSDEFPGGFPAEPEPEHAHPTGPLSRVRKSYVVIALLVVLALGGGYLLGTAGGAAPAAASATTSETTSAAPLTSLPPVKSAPVVPSPPVKIEIPAIGVSGGLVDLHLNPDGTLEVPKDYQQVGWYADGAVPGDTNYPPTIIAGHVDSYQGPAVFYDLRKLKANDKVRVTQKDGKIAVYTVYATAEYPKTKFPADTVYAKRAESELVLITCTGAFDTSARSYDDNLVVSARLDPSLSGTSAS